MVCWCQIKAHLLPGQQWGYSYSSFIFFFLHKHFFSSQFSLQLKTRRYKREPFPQPFFCSPILHLGLDFPDRFMFLFTHSVCSAAFLVCTVMSSQLTSGPLHSIQEQEECTPMEHHQSSACLLFPFLCFSICLSSSTTSSIQSFLFPGEFLDMTVNKDTVYCSTHLR